MLKIFKPFIYPNRIPAYYKELSSIIKTNFDLINNKETKPSHLQYGQLRKDRAFDFSNSLKNQIKNFKKHNDAKEIFYTVEIGTFFGESLKLMGDICEKNLENFSIISIDPYKKFENVGKKNIGWHNKMSKNIKKVYRIFINNLSNYTFKKNVIHIRKSSDEAFLLLQNLNLKIDFCFIDGSHLYENMKCDYVNYSKLIRKNKKYCGLISGDDYEYSFEELLKLSKKKENELLSILNDLKNIDYTVLKTSNKRKFGFHPGITLFFKELDDKIIKFKSGFWIKEN